MKTTFLIKLALAGWLVLASLAARADDIDIYGGTSSSAVPNVLIIVDNTSSNDASYSSVCPFSAAPTNLANSTLLDMVYCSIYGALDAIKSQPALLGKLNVGLMVGGSGSNKGGQMYYPSASPYNLPLMNATNIASFESLVAAGIPKATGNAKLDGDMQEAWAWLTGNTGRSGTSYAAHIGTVACQKTIIILIGASAKQGRPDTGSGFSSAAELASAGATAAQQVQISTANLGANTGNDGAWIDEWARFLKQSNFNTASDPQNVVTYTIAAGGTALDYNQILRSTAYQGGGKPFIGGDYNSMLQALLQIFNEVQAVNSVFASASLPVSASAQGTYLNQVFMGSFRPDAGDGPRWMGNLKQYQFGLDTTNPKDPALFLGDASRGPYQPNTTANAALNSNTGFLAPTAISYWTGKDTTTAPDAASSVTNGTNGFWVNNPQSAGGAFDSPDGEVVEKGGAAQQIRLANLTDNYATKPAGPRNVYTCLGSSCATNSLLSLMPFATTNANITAAILGTNGPALGITSIARSSSTATVTLSSAPSPALVAGQSVTIAGSLYREFNGTFSITPLTTTTFTYPITIDPPTPSTGTYTASVPSNPIAVALTRSGTTVTGTTTAAHGYATGQTVTVAGATGSRYNGSYAVTSTGTNTFSYTISDAPATPDGGGTAKVGSTSYTIPAGGIVRSASNASNVSNVTVTLASTITFSTGNTVTISGAGTGGISAYNGTSWAITNTGTGCTGGSKSGNKPLSFCFNISTTPVSPDPSAAITADGGTSPLAITGLSYTAGTCSATAYSTVLVTATTSSAPTFVAGDFVSVGGTVAANESAYVGSFKVVSVKTSTPYNFTYNIPTSPGTASTCTDSTSGMTATTQGVSKDSLINWVRGDDNVGDESSPGNGITIRPSVHGDVLHSRPAVINYGGTTGVVVFYGANDGMFRAVNGNQPPAANAAPAPMGSCTLSTKCNIGGIPPGGELWSFVPPEFYPKLQRLYNNSPLVQLATTPTGIMPSPQPKDYYFDGTPGVYQNAAANKAYIFLSARRGGRLLYALDVSDPAAPKFMWEHTSADAGFSELGQTWSQPKVAFIKGNTNPVLIFGAGYDPNEDVEPPKTDTMGRGIFILDAVTGALLWQASPNATCATGATCVQVSGMTYAMPADITLVDRNFDGYIDRLYAADLGGNIWRVDLEPVPTSTSLSKAQVTLLASLGGTGTTQRKMFFPPDVVPTKKIDVVVASTGDREHPLSTQQADNIVNRFYMIKDTNVGMSAAGWTAVSDATSSTADKQPPMLFNAASTPYDGTLSGFYISLSGTGEKGVNAPTTVGGIVYFGTNKPGAASSTSCQGNLGTAQGYAVNFMTGQWTSTVFSGGGLPPSPVFGVVSVNGRQFPFLIGGGIGSGSDKYSGLGAAKAVIPVKSTRKRTYWYRNVDQ